MSQQELEDHQHELRANAHPEDEAQRKLEARLIEDAKRHMHKLHVAQVERLAAWVEANADRVWIEWKTRGCPGPWSKFLADKMRASAEGVTM